MGEKVDRDWKTYRITGLDGEPIESRNEVELRLTTDKGVILRLFAAKDSSKEFSFHFSLDNSSDEGNRLLFRNTLRFDPLLEYDIESKTYKGPFSQSGYTFQELPEVFKDYSIEYRTNSDSQKIPYAEKQKGSHSGSKFIITHPKYPELTVDKGENPGPFVAKKRKLLQFLNQLIIRFPF